MTNKNPTADNPLNDSAEAIGEQATNRRQRGQGIDVGRGENRQPTRSMRVVRRPRTVWTVRLQRSTSARTNCQADRRSRNSRMRPRIG